MFLPPTWLLECINSYWQFKSSFLKGSNFLMAKEIGKSFQCGGIYQAKTHTTVYTLPGVQNSKNQSSLILFFSGKCLFTHFWIKGVESKNLTLFPSKADSISCLTELHSYSKELSLSFDSSLGKAFGFYFTELPQPYQSWRNQHHCTHPGRCKSVLITK